MSIKETIKCGFCEQKINTNKEVPYSHYLTEYFCDLNCMDSRYSDYMGTVYIKAGSK